MTNYQLTNYKEILTFQDIWFSYGKAHQQKRLPWQNARNAGAILHREDDLTSIVSSLTKRLHSWADKNNFENFCQQSLISGKFNPWVFQSTQNHTRGANNVSALLSATDKLPQEHPKKWQQRRRHLVRHRGAWASLNITHCDPTVDMSRTKSFIPIYRSFYSLHNIFHTNHTEFDDRVLTYHARWTFRSLFWWTFNFPWCGWRKE